MATEKASASQPPSLNTSSSATPVISQVESPSVSTPQARARFEFENGHGNEGTKILMVEWEDDQSTSNIPGKWTISWEGQPARNGHESSLLPAAESTASVAISSPTTTPKKRGRSHEVETSAGKTHRIYFLLGPRRQVPSIVTLTLTPHDSSMKPIVWKTNPLPAIFPPGLADEETVKRGKGVLHNMWATRRLQRLEQEIEEEGKSNCEGIAFQLALSEREWIEKEFGVSVLGADIGGSSALSPKLQSTGGLNIRQLPHGDASLSPSSPLSPGGSRLSEKLKGLKLQTSPKSSVKPADDEVAVPPCKDKIEKLVAEKATSTAPTAQLSQSNPAEVSSIGAVFTDGTSSQSSEVGSTTGSGADEEEELFALPLSPRSPEMAKSPFSWAAEDTRRYLSLAQSVS
jgi:hypothetical protein